MAEIKWDLNEIDLLIEHYQELVTAIDQRPETAHLLRLRASINANLLSLGRVRDQYLVRGSLTESNEETLNRIYHSYNLYEDQIAETMDA